VYNATIVYLHYCSVFNKWDVLKINKFTATVDKLHIKFKENQIKE